MNPATQPSIPHTLRLFKAEALAQQGLHREAESLLGGTSNPPEDPVLLHALATVVTQQGDFERAARLWRLLQARQPGHREAERMLAAIETWEERPVWVKFAPGAAAALLALGLALWLWPSSAPASASSQASVAPTANLASVSPTQVVTVRPLPGAYVPLAPVTPLPAATQPATEDVPPVVLFKVAPPKPARK